jgi:hypothetical protein
MIKPPAALAAARKKTKTSDLYVSSYLGKSEKGIYSALIDLDGPQFNYFSDYPCSQSLLFIWSILYK